MNTFRLRADFAEATAGVRPTFALYTDDRPPSREEWNRLIQEIDDTVRAQFGKEELQQVAEISPHNLTHQFATLTALEMALGYSVEVLSQYGSGSKPIPEQAMTMLRWLHKLVHREPHLAREAFMDFLIRYKKSIAFTED